MSAADARMAAEAGADAIGMIFHPPARRCIDINIARRIVAALPPFVTPVGVFVDADEHTVMETSEAAGFMVAQLNGMETPQQVRQLRREGLRILKSIRVDGDFEKNVQLWRHFSADADALCGIVLETAVLGAAGGSGIANDWPRIRKLQADGALAGLPPIVAAGGLSPGTVTEVIATIRPWAVDVSSGVESAVGRKSREKVVRFIEAARTADSK